MENQIKQAIEKAADKFVNNEICFGGLEYTLSGKTAEECRKSFIACSNLLLPLLLKCIEERNSQLRQNCERWAIANNLSISEAYQEFDKGVVIKDRELLKLLGES